MILRPTHYHSNLWPNNPDALSPAMALRFAIKDRWRRVADLERHYTTVMRAFIVIVLALVVLFGVLAVTPWGHDFIAVRSTRYAPGYSKQALRSVRIGDSREQVVALLGQPLSSYFIVAPSNGIPKQVPVLPADLPADVYVREVLNFSAAISGRGDFHWAAVILDRSSRVESTCDYVID